LQFETISLPEEALFLSATILGVQQNERL